MRNRRWQNEVGGWLARFLNDDLNAAFLRYDKTGLLRAADLAGVEFQGDPNDDSFLPPLYLLKGNAEIWSPERVQDFLKRPTDEEKAVLTDMLIQLEGVRNNIIIVMDHIAQNEGGKLLRGLRKVESLSELLDARSDGVVQSGFNTKGDSFQLHYQLKLDEVGGYPKIHRWDGLVAHLFIEFMQSDGWRRLRACKICGQYAMKSRVDWKTCSSKCRVKNADKSQQG